MSQKDQSFLKTLIRVDETWSIVLISLQSLKYLYRRHCCTASEKILQTKSAVKAMMIIFLHYKNIFYQQVEPLKTTVNGEYCVSVLKILQQHILRKPHNLMRGLDKCWPACHYFSSLIS